MGVDAEQFALNALLSIPCYVGKFKCYCLGKQSRLARSNVDQRYCVDVLCYESMIENAT